MRFRLFALPATMLFLTVPSAISQGISGGMSAGCDDASCKITFTVASTGMTAITGAAYSGRQSMENMRTLADGTHITNPSPLGTTTYRDSMGRLRTERPVFGGRSPVDFAAVEILDPVAGYVYVLDSVNRVAHRVPVQTHTMTVPPASSVNNPVSEPLGRQVMFGVTLEGRKTTITYPAGSPMGNDRPVTTVSEIWTDPKNSVVVLRKSISLTGDSTMTLQNYSNAEPDPALFQIPAGYNVVDEPTGAFTIVMARAK